jgi:hypothetical protein
MKTAFALMAQHEKAVLPLDDICEEYFGCKKKTAEGKALAGSLPVAAFRIGTQKGRWMVHVTDLAEMIDKQREEAKKDWIGAK